MTTCSADHRGLIRIAITASFNEADPTKPFDFVTFIKSFYEQAKTALKDDLLAYDMARLMPELATQVLTTDAATKPLADGKSLRDKMRSAGVTLGTLDDLIVRYENAAEVNKDLGLNLDPNTAIEAAEEVANEQKPVEIEIKPAEESVKEVIENPFKTIAFGAFFSFGPELVQWEDPNKPGYMQPRPGQETNYATLRYIDAVMRRQIDAKGIQDSGEMELPGIGKVFLKIMHTVELSQAFKKNFPKEYFNAGDLIAVLVDENGREIMFSKEGKPDQTGLPVFFRPYATIARNQDGTVATTQEEFNNYFKRTGQKAHGGFTGSFNSIKQKVKNIAAEKRKANPDLTEVEATEQATKELQDDFSTFFKMSDYLF
jgi:hypothetical protein